MSLPNPVVLDSSASSPAAGRASARLRCVPGTSVDRAGSPRSDVSAAEFPRRDPRHRALYAHTALAAIPRLLGAVDRNPLSPTYGCMDRQYWHYRTACFASEMYQEGVLPLAYAAAVDLPGNRWYGEERVAELAAAGIRFAARHCRADGSCDDYYPFEKAFGAAVFSLCACTAAYQLLDLDDPEIVAWFRRRATWLTENDESGRLTNHHALAALGLARTHEITGDVSHKRAAEAAVSRVLAWQHEEGWFEEYGGADPGYQTVTIDCLAKLRKMWNATELDEPLRRAVCFARCFLHPDGSYGGEYGSRGTYHFYPHGFELMAATDSDAAEMADAFLEGLACDRHADFSDDRLFAHRLGNLFEAFRDWSTTQPSACLAAQTRPTRLFPAAGLLVRRDPARQTVISTARGGVFKHFAEGRLLAADAGLILETRDGRLAVSQMHESPLPQTGDAGPMRKTEVRRDGDAITSVTVEGPLHWTRFETATPLKQAVLHLGMVSIGRFCRTLVRKLLQKRLITGRRAAPVKLTRTFDFEPPANEKGHPLHAPLLTVTDVIELTDPRLRVRRMAFGSDHQIGYTAASGVFQQSVLTPWHDLSEQVEALNETRRIAIVRRFS